MSDDPNPLDRLFIEDEDDPPDEVVVDQLTTMDARDFRDGIEALADAAAVVSTLADDVERLRNTGLRESDAVDLLYGRNSGLTKTQIRAVIDAINDIERGSDRTLLKRLLADLSTANLSETETVMSELERLQENYGDRDE